MSLLSPKIGRLLRKCFFFFHLWAGLSIGLYFSLMGLTGSVLVFERDLHPLVTPELRSVRPPRPGADLLPLSEVLAAMQQQLSGDIGKHLGRIEMPATSAGAYSLMAGDPEQPFQVREVTVDPYTGRILRSRRAVTSPLSFVVLLHTELLWGKTGTRLQSILGLLATALVLSGVWLWWPATCRQIKARLTVKRDARGRRLAHELHNVCGMYGLPLLFLATLTGATLGNTALVQTWLYALTGTKEAKKITVRKPPNGTRLPPTVLLRIAESIEPRRVPVKSLTLPTKSSQPFVVLKSRSEAGFLQRITLSLDPYTGKVLRVEDERTAPAGRRILRFWTRLHFGWWGEWFTKILYSLAGLLPTLLFGTGLYQYAHWRRARTINRTHKQQPQEKDTTLHEIDTADEKEHASGNVKESL